MSADFWPVLTMGIVILIAIAASNRSLRRELGERIDGVQRELGKRIDSVQRELGERIDGLGKRIDGVQRELADVRERLGRVEGLLEGFGLMRWKEARKARGDEKEVSS